jgi:hypothetical protein
LKTVTLFASGTESARLAVDCDWAAQCYDCARNSAAPTGTLSFNIISSRLFFFSSQTHREKKAPLLAHSLCVCKRKERKFPRFCLRRQIRFCAHLGAVAVSRTQKLLFFSLNLQHLWEYSLPFSRAATSTLAPSSKRKERKRNPLTISRLFSLPLACGNTRCSQVAKLERDASVFCSCENVSQFCGFHFQGELRASVSDNHVHTSDFVAHNVNLFYIVN